MFRYVSPSSINLLGWKPEEMIGRMVDDYIQAEDYPGFASAVARIFSPDVQQESATARIKKKDGSAVWMEMNARLIRDSVTGQPKEFVVVMRYITARKRLEEQLSSLALTDGLPGLLNRRAFDDALAREWKRTLREGSQISLLLLDVDLFKEFNDCYGHPAGDGCLRAAAAAIVGTVRTTDIAARYGGDEIAVILPSTEGGDAITVAEKVRSAIEQCGLLMKEIRRGESGLLLALALPPHLRAVAEK